MANRKKRLAREQAQLQKNLTFKKQLRSHKNQKTKGIVGVFEQMKQVKFRPSLMQGNVYQKYPSDFFAGAGYLQDFYNTRKYRSAQGRLNEIIRHPKLVGVSINFAAGLVYFLKIYHEFVHPFETWNPPKSNNEDVLFKSIFTHLFVRYPLPRSVGQCISPSNFIQVNSTAFKLVAEMIDGIGIHKIKLEAIKLTGKMNFIFQNAPDRFELFEAIWWAKIRGMGASEKTAYLIIGQIEPQQWTDWESWMDDFIFFIKKMNLTDGKLMKEIFRFIKYQQKHEGLYVKIEGNDHIRVPEIYPNYSLKGRSLCSVKKHLDEWKTQIEQVKTVKHIRDFAEPPLKKFRYESNHNEYVIRRLKNFKELAEEGRKMKHCVASYFDDCMKGESSIWSVRRKGDSNNFKRLATVEIEFFDEKYRLGEFQGKCNTRPSDFTIHLVKTWAKEHGIETEDWSYC